MSDLSPEPASIEPRLRARHEDFIQYACRKRQESMHDIIEPYKRYDSRLREIFAQQPDHPALAEPSIVPIFRGHQSDIRIRARNLETETEQERQCYLLPLDQCKRKPSGSPAVVQSIKEFQNNFSIFSESALADMDWSNVVVAGSAALTPLLPVPVEHAGSKRALRKYYHETIAPASDVDLFLYGLTEAQAIEKIKQIEQKIRDSILAETTTIRTKNAITIVSQYPTRHVQIVLRIYRSISEILTGFDVDCSCVAYDGTQVYASPRALAACITQINTIDLTRRSPSYENRLSKYSHRGFEVYWPHLDRSKIDPTIFERSFRRVIGLARLLVLEKLPSSTDREAYQDQRRAERGRPEVNRHYKQAYILRGNIKNQHEDEIAEWVDEEAVSNYHTFSIPYGPKYHARKIEKLLYKKDLLLNAEWNKPKDREVNLHRHPAFFGSVDDVVQDCCGCCPEPLTPEENDVYQLESKQFVSGEVSFLKDDPGRQEIGSFNPITDDDWTEMGYIGNTTVLCNAIVEQDLDAVQDWLSQEGADPNRRDHTGRAPIHLAVMCSSLAVVQCLIDHGARIVARLVNGKTALHLAAMRGSADIVAALLRKSEANEEKEDKKKSQRVVPTSMGASDDLSNRSSSGIGNEDEDSDASMVEDLSIDNDDIDNTTEGSYVKIITKSEDQSLEESKDDEPDVYEVDVLAWDVPVSPLHLAIVWGHVEVVRTLISEFGASPLLPVKLVHKYNNSARGAILPLVLASYLPIGKAEVMIKALVDLGASPAQGDMNQITPLQLFAADRSELMQILLDSDKAGSKRALNHVAVSYQSNELRAITPLLCAVVQGDETAVETLLKAGAKPQVDFAAFWDSCKRRPANAYPYHKSLERYEHEFKIKVQQPVLIAAECGLPSLVLKLVASGADINTLTPHAYAAMGVPGYLRIQKKGQSLLDVVNEKIRSLESYERGDAAKRPQHPHDYGPPAPLDDDAVYLGSSDTDSYAYWTISEQLRLAKVEYQTKLKAYNEHIQKKNKKREGLPEKREAVIELRQEFESLRNELVKQGAKAFKDLHPDANQIEGRDQCDDWEPPKPEPWKPVFTYQRQPGLPSYIGDATERQADYRNLFQASWAGDIPAIKEYALMAQKDGESILPPLDVSTRDHFGFSPFQICVLRGHLESARIILEISRIQYAPEQESKKRQYTLGNGYHSEDSQGEGSCDEFEIQSVIVDEQYTIDDIGELHLQVQNRTPPLKLLQDNCPNPCGGTAMDLLEAFKRMQGTSLEEETDTLAHADDCKPSTLFQLAARLNDHKLFLFLLDLAEDQATRRLPGNLVEKLPNFYEFGVIDLRYTMRYGRTKMLAELVKRTGAGISLDALAEKSGVAMTDDPKHYQGLTVHGKKRADWARRERHGHLQPSQGSYAPLLEAALTGSLSTVSWLEREEARSFYIEFAEANQNDQRLKSLAQSTDGLDGSISKSLNHHSHLVMHCVVMSKNISGSIKLLEYLVKTQPSLMQVRCLAGFTPLHLAFSLHRRRQAEILIDAGADQTSRDSEGNNLIHSTLIRGNGAARGKPCNVKAMLSLISTPLLPILFRERSSADCGSVTPLARYLFKARNRKQHSSGRADNQQITTSMGRVVLQFSRGVELDTVNGEGDTPLHSAVKYQTPDALELMLDHQPELLFRENATGSTPYEMAQDAYLDNLLADPPQLPNVSAHSTFYRGYVPSRFREVLVREPESFLPEAKAETEELSDKEKVWLVCRKYEEKLSHMGKGDKRRLVSLLEANEVAKRLALRERGKKRGEFNGEPDENTEQATDVVQLWYHSALLPDECTCGQEHADEDDDD